MASKVEFQLHSLCSRGKFDEIFNYLEKNNSEVNKYDKRGFAPIHYAIGRDGADIEQVLSLLYTHNVDINLRTLREGDTGLHIAVTRFDDMDAQILALKLLSLGADPDYRNDNHRTPYDIAMAKGNVALAELFTEQIPQEQAAKDLKKQRVEHYGEKLIGIIMGDGTIDDVKACLQQGGDPNYLNKHGAAAIHYTITHSPLDKGQLLDALVNAGADVNLLTYEKDNALNLVIKTENLRADDQMSLLVMQLLEWGSNIRQRDLDGNDALALARARKYDDIVSLLITNRGMGGGGGPVGGGGGGYGSGGSGGGSGMGGDGGGGTSRDTDDGRNTTRDMDMKSTATGTAPRPTLHRRQTKQVEMSFKGKED